MRKSCLAHFSSDSLRHSVYRLGIHNHIPGRGRYGLEKAEDGDVDPSSFYSMGYGVVGGDTGTPCTRHRCEDFTSIFLVSDVVLNSVTASLL